MRVKGGIEAFLFWIQYVFKLSQNPIIYRSMGSWNACITNFLSITDSLHSITDSLTHLFCLEQYYKFVARKYFSSFKKYFLGYNMHSKVYFLCYNFIADDAKCLIIVFFSFLDESFLPDFDASEGGIEAFLFWIQYVSS